MDLGEQEPWHRGTRMGKSDSHPPARMDDYDYSFEVASRDWAYVSTAQILVSLPYTSQDSHGNPIPSDATWTRIDRRFISVEMLQKAGVRYEAREDFVAILGAVTSAQVVELVQHSTAIRQQRRPRHGTHVAAPYRAKSHESQFAQTNTPRAGRSALLTAESDSDEDVNRSSGPKSRNRERLQRRTVRGGKQRDQLQGETTYSVSRLQASGQSTSKMLPRQSLKSTKGDLAVKTLSIAGSVASVISLAKDFLKE
ncbi:hypothetical protein MAA_07541 [Metarhizium robertsii ARSEF 23]|nr:uncharacterized protein MAA_07541 [Metarhizium robertsii ARSEF 23]EFY96995.2 hypothetical protein MAA_07541 [Metarhizium robertsii ARSEF 23]